MILVFGGSLRLNCAGFYVTSACTGIAIAIPVHRGFANIGYII
ncbi:hypothetical protein [Nostoc sp. 106C]|nr:hypothetical protein [Nostoc sp. 106C]